MKNKQIILLLASTFMLAGCGKKEPVHTHSFGNWVKADEQNHEKTCSCGETIKAPHNFDDGVIAKEPNLFEDGIIKYTCSDCGTTKTSSYSLDEEDKKQYAYEMISNAYDYLENYNGDFYRTNSFEAIERGKPLSTYKEEIIYDNDSKECLYQMDKDNDAIYQYFNKKDVNSNSYEMYVNTTFSDQKLKYKSNEDCIGHFMNLYNNPLQYTDYDDVSFDVDDIEALLILRGCFAASNSEKHNFLKQTTYQDGLEYFKEYFTLVYSCLLRADNRINDLSSSLTYEKVNDKTIIKFSGESTTDLEDEKGLNSEHIEIEMDYIFELDSDSHFTSIQRNISTDRHNGDGPLAIYFDVSNTETFSYDIEDWKLNEDTAGYTDTNVYPLQSLEVEVFQTCNGLAFYSDSSLTNFKGDEIIDFDYLDKVVNIIPNQKNIKYRKEGTKIEKVYLDPECTKEFTGTDMKMGKLTLYCTYDYLDNVCVATERYITDISAYNYKFANEILFDDRIACSYEHNFIGFSETKEMRCSEDDFERKYSPIGFTSLLNVTIDNVTYSKEELLEGITYSLNDRTVITYNRSVAE